MARRKARKQPEKAENEDRLPGVLRVCQIAVSSHERGCECEARETYLCGQVNMDVDSEKQDLSEIRRWKFLITAYHPPSKAGIRTCSKHKKKVIDYLIGT